MTLGGITTLIFLFICCNTSAITASPCVHTSGNLITQTLTNLIQFDIDMYHAYTIAMDVVKEDKEINLPTKKLVYGTFLRFRGDHEKHIDMLTPLVQQLGGISPDFRHDFTDFIILNYVAILSATGTIGALKAMQATEIIVNDQYARAATMEAPASIKEAIAENLEDAGYHLEALSRLIEDLEKGPLQ